MNIVSEIENTISGNLVVVKNENGSFAVGFLNKDGFFEENEFIEFMPLKHQVQHV